MATIRRWFGARRASPADNPLGRRGEAAAEKLLRRGGYRILNRNLKLGVGEIDLLAEDPRDRSIVIVEVKAGSSDDPPPEMHVDGRKRRKLTQLGAALMRRRGMKNRAIRFDVVAVVWPAGSQEPTRVTHHVAAFEARGR